MPVDKKFQVKKTKNGPEMKVEVVASSMVDRDGCY